MLDRHSFFSDFPSLWLDISPPIAPNVLDKENVRKYGFLIFRTEGNMFVDLTFSDLYEPRGPCKVDLKAGFMLDFTAVQYALRELCGEIIFWSLLISGNKLSVVDLL